MRYIVISLEAAFEIDNEVGESIRYTLEQLRGLAAARAVNFQILETDAEYEEWYNSPRIISSVDVPVPQTITFDI